MAWFDKALKSVQTTAEKTAFEADKLVRVKREEGVLGDAQKRVQSKVAELGQATLSLYRGGVLSDPTVAALTEEITALEAQVQQQKDKLEAVRNEQYQPAVQPTSPAASEPAAQPDAAAAEPASSLAAPAPSEPAASGTIACPHCHTEVKATVTFCPECGNRIK